MVRLTSLRAIVRGCDRVSWLSSRGFQTRSASLWGSNKEKSPPPHDHDDSEGHFPEVVSEQQFKVPSFGGSVWVKSPLSVKVKPAGTLDYPNLDRSFVRLLSRLPHEPSGDVGLDVVQSGQELSVVAHGNIADRKNFLADVEVPIVHNVTVNALDEAQVDVHDFMESSYISVTSERGRVRTHKIKTDQLTIRSDAGDVVCRGQINGGNVKIASGSGDIVVEKRLLGANLELETESGDIRVASSYSEQSKFSTSTGSMNLRNVHNESYVAIYEQGDVRMQGVDGSTNVFVKKGDVDVQVSRVVHESRIHVEDGDIHLKLSDAFPLKVSIEANDVVPDAKFRSYGKAEKKSDGSGSVQFFAAIEPNKFSPSLVVVAENGTVVLDSQDWAASLGLKLKTDSADALSKT